MLKNLVRILVFSCFIWMISLTGVSAQIVGGGSLEKPIASQLGGLVNANVFKRLNSPVRNKPQTTPVKSNTASKTAKNSKNTSKIPSKTPVKTPAPIIVNNYSNITFNPINNAGTDRDLASTLTNNRTEQEALVEVFKVTKTTYEAEAAKKGKSNDVAMATTFFIASCLTVYHDAPEPSEAAIDSLYNALAESMNEDETFARTSNLDKQILHDKLIYLSGLVLGGYTAGNHQNNEATVQIFRYLGGVCLRSLLQLDPDKLSFNETGLVVKP